jgi:hypothetical protein
MSAAAVISAPSAVPKEDPAPHLQPYRFKPGVGGGGRGRPKGFASLRQRFRAAFVEAPADGKESLVDVVISIARGEAMTATMIRAIESGLEPDDPEHSKRLARLVQELNRDAKGQLAAIEFAAHYGFGPPPKADDDGAKLGGLVAKAIEALVAQAEAKLAEAESRPGAIDVTPTGPK